MNKKLIILIILIIITILNMGSIFAAVEPVPDELKNIDELVTKTMEDWKVPGLALAVVKDGKVIYQKAYGYRDLKNKLEVTDETIFPIGSCTKAFTGTLIGILADEGKIDLDKPVKDYLPSFKMNEEYPTNHVTTRDILTHRTGLPGHDAAWYTNKVNARQVYDSIKYLELNKELREEFQYNNIMYAATDFLISEITGKSWADNVREKIFEPLDMNESNFTIEDIKKGDNYSLPYDVYKGEIEEIPFYDLSCIAPAGAINSNIKDMSNWLLMNVNKGKFDDKQIISEKMFKEVTRPEMVMPEDLSRDEYMYDSYGLGWTVRAYKGNLLVHHCGEIDGFQSHVSFMPRKNIGVVMLINNPGMIINSIPYSIYDRLLDLEQTDWSGTFLKEEVNMDDIIEKVKAASEAAKVKGTKPSHDLQDYTGTYKHPAYGTVTIEKSGKKLKGKFRGLPVFLNHYHYDVFAMISEEYPDSIPQNITFITDPAGNIDGFTMKLEPRVADIKFKKVEEQKIKPVEDSNK